MKKTENDIVTKGFLKQTLNEALLPIYEILIRLENRSYKTDERLEQVDKRLDKMDKRFEQIDKRFEQIDNRFAQIDKRFNALMLYLDHRFEPLEAMAQDYPIFKDSVLSSLDWLVTKYKKFDEGQEILNRRVSILEGKQSD